MPLTDLWNSACAVGDFCDYLSMYQGRSGKVTAELRRPARRCVRAHFAGVDGETSRASLAGALDAVVWNFLRLLISLEPRASALGALDRTAIGIVCLLFVTSCSNQLDDRQAGLLAEIASADDTITWLAPNDAAAFYIFSEKTSNCLRYFDEVADSERVIPAGSSVAKTYSWSPAQRRLPVQIQEAKFKDYAGGGRAKTSWLVLCSATNAPPQRLTADRDVVEQVPLWLNKDQLLFSSRSLTQPGMGVRRLVYSISTEKCRPAAEQGRNPVQPELLAADSVLMRLKDNVVLSAKAGIPSRRRCWRSSLARGLTVCCSAWHWPFPSGY